MEKEIKIGDYVRTKDGRIAKIKSIDYEARIFRFDKIIYINVFGDKSDVIYNNHMFKKLIVKHSKNLIDLIELGDYVNGYKILRIDETSEKTKKAFKIFQQGEKEFFKIWEDKDIINILSYEQYKVDCYINEIF